MFKERLRRKISSLALAILFAAPVFAQERVNQQRETRDGEQTKYPNQELSDLAKENLNRVAASPSQVRAVLVKDEGLLVELKRWVVGLYPEPAVDDEMVSDAGARKFAQPTCACHLWFGA